MVAYGCRGYTSTPQLDLDYCPQFDEICENFQKGKRAAFYGVLNGQVQISPVFCAPLHWKSDPYVPEKKFSVTQTVYGSVIQMSCEQFSHGTKSIEYDLDPATAEEVTDLIGIYRIANSGDLNGFAYCSHWGEILHVHMLEAPRVDPIGSGLFRVRGKLLVACEICDMDLEKATCIPNPDNDPLLPYCCPGQDYPPDES